MRLGLLVSAFSTALLISALSSGDPQASGGVQIGAGAQVGAGATATATAQAPAAPAPKTDARGKSPYGPKLVKGHGAYAARDFPAAIAAYKEAIAESPTDPSGYYFLGEAQLAAGNKKAWEDYSQFVTTHPNANGYVATATERIKMVDTRVDLEAKYGEVKKRIEQRLKETTSPAPPPDDGPQAPAKKK